MNVSEGFEELWIQMWIGMADCHPDQCMICKALCIYIRSPGLFCVRVYRDINLRFLRYLLSLHIYMTSVLCKPADG